jgi:secretion/DNA translocation related TadE-like protein
VRSESGAGTVLALMILVGILGIFSVASIYSLRLLEMARLEAKTEAVALAAADALLGWSVGYPCIVAKDVAEMNGIVLSRCRIVGFEVYVETLSSEDASALRARARAGPSE